MTVVIRPRPWTVAFGAAGCVVFGLLLAADETAPPPPPWVVGLLVVGFLVMAARSRVEVGPDRVRIARPFRSDEILRSRVIAVRAWAGRGRPPAVSISDAGPADGARLLVLPMLVAPHRVADALAAPYLSIRGEPVAPVELGTRWVAVVAIVLATAAVALAVGFTFWG